MKNEQQGSLNFETERLPLNIRQLVDQANSEMIEYGSRASDVQQLQDWLAKGDHGMAEFKAKQIVERQQQFRRTQQHGLPAGLQLLIDQANAEMIEYSGRADDVQQLQDWLAKGDHDMAEFKAKQIVERQRNIRGRS